MSFSISLQELYVLLDALSGSSKIEDRLGLWDYSKATREALLNSIVARMTSIQLTVEEEK